MMDFSETLRDLLKADLPLRTATLYGLSGLEPEELERLTSSWFSISLTRRHTLVKELVDITETNFEVDFESIFRWGLQDDDADVRAMCVEGLWENENLTLMNELLYLLQTDPSDKVRAAAAMSLGRFLLLSELGKLPSERCQEVYESLYNTVLEGNEALEVRRRALESISYVSRDEVIVLIQSAFDHPAEEMRVSAVFGMGRSADPRWIGDVMGELFSIDPEMRYEAARACGELQARMAVPRLAELIDDPDREVQEAALWAIGQAGGDEARRLLETCCEEGDEVTRSAAEEALQELQFLYGQLDFPFYAMNDVESDPSL
jgi:HEAT repeat protein